MSFKIGYIRNLNEILEPAERFLSQPLSDLFARQHVVVPTAGVKAWLSAQLATRLGKSDSDLGDGVIANVEFSYPGAIIRFLQSAEDGAHDPWSLERLTFVVLEVLAERERDFQQVIRSSGGLLLAARSIADRFDHYHFRRPGMINQWESGSRTLCPAAADDGNRLETALADSDRWQFDLWRLVRERIGSPSPPCRERVSPQSVPESILVAGLQGISLHQFEVLRHLSELTAANGQTCRVEVLLVHPSPRLHEDWDKKAPELSLGLVPCRRELWPIAGFDLLPQSWLRGTRESQWLLASQGVRPIHQQVVSPDPDDSSLLARMQRTIAEGSLAIQPAFALDDMSFRVHRCHDLSRQAEVLHDAILHAFGEIPDLAPHDVVIVSPQIADLAPHLEAVFSRKLTQTFEQNHRAVELPLVIADRGISETSRGAELLANLLELIGSRCSIEAMMNVATHPLVLANFSAGEETVELWKRYLERTKIRWGLDGRRRTELVPGLPEFHAHTWRQGLERLLLGAVLPDHEPQPALGATVPLDGISTADIPSIAILISIFRIIEELDSSIAENRSTVDWCDRLETAVCQLGGAENSELVVPLRELDELRRNSAWRIGETTDVPRSSPSREILIPFDELKLILAGKLTSLVGRQPLWTGAITASSMIPLRGVPFKVICVAGFDSEATSPSESDCNDLVQRQELLGDPDQRLEVRRSLLDYLMSAKNRLIVTCSGMSVRNNKLQPHATPLAELIDFAVRHGVEEVKQHGESLCKIEVIHPRHASSRNNFLPGLVGGPKVWSHDTVARSIAESLGKSNSERQTPRVRTPAQSEQPGTRPIIKLEWLAEFMRDPLWPFVRQTLEINPWRDDESALPATVPFELDKLELRRLRQQHFKGLLQANDAETFRAQWTSAVEDNGDVPVFGFGTFTVQTVTGFNEQLLKEAREHGIDLRAGRALPVRLNLDAIELHGEVDGTYDAKPIVLVRPDATTSDKFTKPKLEATVRLLALLASGHQTREAMVFNQHNDWEPTGIRGNDVPPNAVQIRRVNLRNDISQDQAKQILAELGRLYLKATIQPFGLFGKAAEALYGSRDASKANSEFQKHISGRSYKTTNGAVLFGLQPKFSDAFPDASHEQQAFFTRFINLTKFKTGKHLYDPQ